MAEKSQTKAAAAMADDKKRAIETAMQQIERTYGKGSIMRFGDNTVSNVEAISTGSLALDLALGIGGLRSRARWATALSVCTRASCRRRCAS